MSEMFINLPDGTPAVVSGLPEQQHITQAQTTKPAHEPNTVNGHPEIGIENPLAIVGVVTGLGLATWAAYHRHKQKTETYGLR